MSLGWDRWVGDGGAIVGLDHFGASAPAGTIFEKFGFTVDRVVGVARDVLAGKLRGPVPTLEPGHLPAARRGHDGGGHGGAKGEGGATGRDGEGGATGRDGEDERGGRDGRDGADGSHPTLDAGESATGRTQSSDPGHS